MYLYRTTQDAQTNIHAPGRNWTRHPIVRVVVPHPFASFIPLFHSLLPPIFIHHPFVRLRAVLQVNKVKQSYNIPWRHRGERRYSFYSIMTSALDGGWVVSITPQPRFAAGERTPSIHWTGGWVGHRAGLYTEARGKILFPCRGSNLDCPVFQSVARHYTSVSQTFGSHGPVRR
jgi:hypothetical protein